MPSCQKCGQGNSFTSLRIKSPMSSTKRNQALTGLDKSMRLIYVIFGDKHISPPNSTQPHWILLVRSSQETMNLNHSNHFNIPKSIQFRSNIWTSYMFYVQVALYQFPSIFNSSTCNAEAVAEGVDCRGNLCPASKCDSDPDGLFGFVKPEHLMGWIGKSTMIEFQPPELLACCITVYCCNAVFYICTMLY